MPVQIADAAGRRAAVCMSHVGTIRTDVEKLKERVNALKRIIYDLLTVIGTLGYLWLNLFFSASLREPKAEEADSMKLSCIAVTALIAFAGAAADAQSCYSNGGGYCHRSPLGQLDSTCSRPCAIGKNAKMKKPMKKVTTHNVAKKVAKTK